MEGRPIIGTLPALGRGILPGIPLATSGALIPPLPETPAPPSSGVTSPAPTSFLRRPLLRPLHFLPLLWLATASVLLACHFRSVHRLPLARYGFNGAEIIEHVQRYRAIEATSGSSWWERLWYLGSDLRHLDGVYPALLHLLAAAWAELVGRDISSSIHINLLFLLLLSGATAGLAWEIGENSPLFRRGGWWGGILVLLFPAVYGTALRYYYDLPMTAWVALALLAWLKAPVSLPWAVVAGLATGAALLTKWVAALHLLPCLPLALLMLRRKKKAGGSRWTVPGRIFVASALALLPILPLLTSSQAWRVMWHKGESASFGLGAMTGSFDETFLMSARIASGVPVPGAMDTGLGEALSFYGDGLFWSSCGPLFTMAMLFCLVLKLPSRLSLLLTLMGFGLPALLIIAFVPIRDERFLLPLLPGVAVLLSSSLASLSGWRVKAASGALLGTGILQLLSVQGIFLPSFPLSPRGSWELRGFNTFAEEKPSPAPDLARFAAHACAEASFTGVPLAVEPEVLASPWWQWALLTGCREEDWEMRATLSGPALLGKPEGQPGVEPIPVPGVRGGWRRGP